MYSKVALTRIFRQIAQVGLKSEWITLRGIFRRGIYSRRQNRVKLNAHYLNTIGPYIAPIQSNDQRNHRKSIFYALFYIDKLAFADRTPKSFFAKINIIDLFLLHVWIIRFCNYLISSFFTISYTHIFVCFHKNKLFFNKTKIRLFQ